jgi:fluoride ion exporter CrcB/FEX
MWFVTTMSSPTLENIELFENNQIIQMIINTISNVVLSFLFIHWQRYNNPNIAITWNKKYMGLCKK